MVVNYDAPSAVGNVRVLSHCKESKRVSSFHILNRHRYCVPPHVRMVLFRRQSTDVSSVYPRQKFCSRGVSSTEETIPTHIIFVSHQRMPTVHRPGDDPRKECKECGNAHGSNVRYYPT
jgi:hypothetical protein